jgi:NAD(P)-dependent dehydrogenase (short-subunit alcohol dehydrogenase family)
MSNQQKSVIVTGGCSGIGLTMARHFASEHHRVTIFDVSPEETGQETARTLSSTYPQAKVTFKRCDVSSWDEQAAAFKAVYEEHGRIDIVMANAGISEQGSTSAINLKEDTPSKPRLKVLDVNLTGVIYSKSLLRVALKTTI